MVNRSGTRHDLRKINKIRSKVYNKNKPSRSIRSRSYSYSSFSIDSYLDKIIQTSKWKDINNE